MLFLIKYASYGVNDTDRVNTESGMKIFHLENLLISILEFALIPRSERVFQSHYFRTLQCVRRD